MITLIDMTGVIKKSYECAEKSNCERCKLGNTKIDKYNRNVCEILKAIRISHYPEFSFKKSGQTNDEKIETLIKFYDADCNISRNCNLCFLNKDKVMINGKEDKICNILYVIGNELKDKKIDKENSLSIKKKKISRMTLEMNEIQSKIEELMNIKKTLAEKIEKEFSNGELFRCNIKFDEIFINKKDGLIPVDINDNIYVAELVVDRMDNRIISSLKINGIIYCGVAKCNDEDEFDFAKGFNISFNRARIAYYEAVIKSLSY